MPGHLLEPLSATSLDLAQQIRVHLGAAEEVGRLTSSRDLDVSESFNSVATVLDKIKSQQQTTQEEQERVRAYYQRLERFSLFFKDIYRAAYPLGEYSGRLELRSSDPEKEKKVERGLRALLANQITVGIYLRQTGHIYDNWLNGATGCLVGQKSCEGDDRMSEIVVADLVRFTYASALVRTDRFNELMERKREAMTRPLTVQEVQRYVSADRSGYVYVGVPWDDTEVPFIGRDLNRLFRKELEPTIKVPLDDIKVGTLFDTGGSQPGPHFVLNPDYQIAPLLARIAQDFGTVGQLKAAAEKSSRYLHSV